MICFIGGFDPISNKEFDFIKESEIKGEKIELCIDNSIDYLETIENRTNFLKGLFKNVKVINQNALKFNNYNKIYKSANLTNLYKEYSGIEMIEEKRNFENNKNNAINIINYSSFNKEIRDQLNFNLMYIDKRLDNVMDFERKTHSLNVGNMAYKLAISNNIKELNLIKEIKFTGAVHDIAKQVSIEEMESILNNIDKSLILEPKPVWHGFAGMYILKNQWLIDNQSILDSVFYHTVGRPNMSLIEKIVFCSDKISSERDYDGVDFFRDSCLYNIDEGFKKLLKNQYEVAVKKHGINSIGKQILLTMDYYLK